MSYRVRVRWHGRRVARDMLDRLHANIVAVARVYRVDVQVEISDPYPPASFPFYPPHTEYGRLIASYVVESDRRTMSARMGSGMINREHGGQAPYARYLEYGTRYPTHPAHPKTGPVRMYRRPHLRPVLYANLHRQYARVIAAPFPP
jgi:hypothetical protein